jgi:hypothetical protein
MLAKYTTRPASPFFLMTSESGKIVAALILEFFDQDHGLGIELGLILKNPLVAFFAQTCTEA